MFTLEVINFQSIAHARLPIRDFTAIIGPSNRGKSAVIRALRAVLYNELHPSFIRHGAKESTLRLHFPDTATHNLRTVEFTKSSTKNIYTLTYADGTTKQFPKMGNTTPEELQELGFTQLTTERDESFNLNFQGQLEPLFLVAETPTTLTSFMNKVFQIEQYERALRNMSTDMVKLGRDFDTIGAQITTKEREHADLITTVDTLTQQRDQLHAALTALTQAEQQAETLATAKAEWEKSLTDEQLAAAQQSKLALLKTAKTHVESLGQQLTRYQRAAELSTTLLSLTQQHDQTATRARPLTTWLSTLNTLGAQLETQQRAAQLATELRTLSKQHADTTVRAQPLKPWLETIETIGRHGKSLHYVRGALTKLTSLEQAHATTLHQRALIQDATVKTDGLTALLQQYSRVRYAIAALTQHATQSAQLTNRLTQLQEAHAESIALEAHWHTAIGHCPLCGHTYNGVAE